MCFEDEFINRFVYSNIAVFQQGDKGVDGFDGLDGSAGPRGDAGPKGYKV